MDTRLDFDRIAELGVVIRKHHESAVRAEKEEAPDTEHVQPNGPIGRHLTRADLANVQGWG